jgi:hypothetical protein
MCGAQPPYLVRHRGVDIMSAGQYFLTLLVILVRLNALALSA